MAFLVFFNSWRFFNLLSWIFFIFAHPLFENWTFHQITHLAGKSTYPLFQSWKLKDCTLEPRLHSAQMLPGTPARWAAALNSCRRKNSNLRTAPGNFLFLSACYCPGHFQPASSSEPTFSPAGETGFGAWSGRFGWYTSCSEAYWYYSAAQEASAANHSFSYRLLSSPEWQKPISWWRICPLCGVSSRPLASCTHMWISYRPFFGAFYVWIWVFSPVFISRSECPPFCCHLLMSCLDSYFLHNCYLFLDFLHLWPQIQRNCRSLISFQILKCEKVLPWPRSPEGHFLIGDFVILTDLNDLSFWWPWTEVSILVSFFYNFLFRLHFDFHLWFQIWLVGQRYSEVFLR